MQGNSQAAIDTRAIEVASKARQIARDAREQCQREYDGLWSEFRSHREETNRRFDKQDIDRAEMHKENQAKFDRLFRALYITIGAGFAASLIVSHGEGALEIMLKLLH